MIDSLGAEESQHGEGQDCPTGTRIRRLDNYLSIWSLVVTDKSEKEIYCIFLFCLPTKFGECRQILNDAIW